MPALVAPAKVIRLKPSATSLPATLDRIRHGAYRVVLAGPSFRDRKSLEDPRPAIENGGKSAHS
jgi:hypothetical protein